MSSITSYSMPGGGIHGYRVLASEEEEISPTLAVYFVGCNARCGFCHAKSFSHCSPQALDVGLLRSILRKSGDLPIRTVSFLGGEPSLYLSGIQEAVQGLHLPPLVLNSNMLFSGYEWRRLEGLIDYFIADLKFGNDDCAADIAHVGDYWATVTYNILEADNRAGVIVRHLVLPGHLECCTKPVIQWIGRYGLRANLMLYYYPNGSGQPDLERELTYEEVKAAHGLAAVFRIAQISTRSPAPQKHAPTLPTATPTEIVVKRDGKILIPDLPEDLVPMITRMFK